MTESEATQHTPAPDAAQIGKRYRCQKCGGEVLVLRGGTAPLSCHDTPMLIVQIRPLPVSD